LTGFLLLVLVAAAVAGGAWLYNSLVGLRNQIGNAWAQIDVQLKRRHDLVPSLVAAVQGYLRHESELLERIAAARTRALEATGAGAIGLAEGALGQAVGGLLAVMERYPDLKADRSVLALQEELVTTGLLAIMTRDELQGVVAHEMAHVRNYDIRKMTVVAALLGAVLLLSDWAMRLRLGRRAAWGSGDRRRGDGGALPGPLGLVLLGLWLLTVLVTPLVGRLLATAVSRRREYLADASGAELTRNPLGLASALRKLEAATAPTAAIHRGTAHLCIADPLGRPVNEREGWLADVLATHPPIGDRIARLEAMGYRRGA
jgi:hypothetical protein